MQNETLERNMPYLFRVQALKSCSPPSSAGPLPYSDRPAAPAKLVLREAIILHSAHVFQDGPVAHIDPWTQLQRFGLWRNVTRRTNTLASFLR